MPHGNAENPEEGLPEDVEDDQATPKDVGRKPADGLELKFEPKTAHETIKRFSQRRTVRVKSVLP